jgi:hypothetical protein
MHCHAATRRHITTSTSHLLHASNKANTKAKALPHPYVKLDSTQSTSSTSTTTPSTLLPEQQPMTIREYLLYIVVAVSSMLLGASLVHRIYQPDLTIPTIEEVEMKKAEKQQMKLLKQQQEQEQAQAPAVQSSVK